MTIIEAFMSYNDCMAYVNNIKEALQNEFDEDKEMEYLVHSCKMSRQAKQLRQTLKKNKTTNSSTKNTQNKKKDLMD
jgi:uncharacterized protein YeeX (DUF496 family)